MFVSMSDQLCHDIYNKNYKSWKFSCKFIKIYTIEYTRSLGCFHVQTILSGYLQQKIPEILDVCKDNSPKTAPACSGAMSIGLMARLLL